MMVEAERQQGAERLPLFSWTANICTIAQVTNSSLRQVHVVLLSVRQYHKMHCDKTDHTKCSNRATKTVMLIWLSYSNSDNMCLVESTWQPEEKNSEASVSVECCSNHLYKQYGFIDYSVNYNI